MGKPRAKRSVDVTVAQKVLAFGIRIDAQKALLNGPVLSRILHHLQPRDRASLGETCKTATKILKGHVEYEKFWSVPAQKHVPFKIGQVLFFKDLFPKNPMDGYYRIRSISPSGISLYRLTRLSRKTVPKRNFFVEFEYNRYIHDKLVKGLRSHDAFLGVEFSDMTLEIVAENKKEFLELWHEHCEMVYPTRKKNQGETDESDWNSKRRSKYVWILDDGQKVYPPCPY